MRITKVYTRTGDKGTTRLVGGAQVRKDDARIEAYGTVDELNAVIGMVRAHLDASAEDEGAIATLDGQLAWIQNDLFDVGADLATEAADRWPGMFRVGVDEATRLEEWIDALNDDLEPLAEFVLPAGGPVTSTLHLARTVCRRAERRVVTLHAEADDVGEGVIVYLNRLSDLLFVMSRWVAKRLGEREVTWVKPDARGA